MPIPPPIQSGAPPSFPLPPPLPGAPDAWTTLPPFQDGLASAWLKEALAMQVDPSSALADGFGWGLIAWGIPVVLGVLLFSTRPRLLPFPVSWPAAATAFLALASLSGAQVHQGLLLAPAAIWVGASAAVLPCALLARLLGWGKSALRPSEGGKAAAQG